MKDFVSPEIEKVNLIKKGIFNTDKRVLIKIS